MSLWWKGGDSCVGAFLGVCESVLLMPCPCCHLLVGPLPSCSPRLFNKCVMPAFVKWSWSHGNNICSSMVSTLYLTFLSLFMNSTPSSLPKMVNIWLRVSIFTISARSSNHGKMLERCTLTAFARWRWQLPILGMFQIDTVLVDLTSINILLM